MEGFAPGRDGKIQRSLVKRVRPAFVEFQDDAAGDLGLGTERGWKRSEAYKNGHPQTDAHEASPAPHCPTRLPSQSPNEFVSIDMNKVYHAP